jgi:hypothetical protein
MLGRALQRPLVHVWWPMAIANAKAASATQLYGPEGRATVVPVSMGLRYSSSAPHLTSMVYIAVSTLNVVPGYSSHSQLFGSRGSPPCRRVATEAMSNQRR